MASGHVPGWLVDRMRANLRVEGIPLAERDVGRMEELGLFRTPLLLAEIEGAVPCATLPDPLAAWDAGEEPADPAPAGRAPVGAPGGASPAKPFPGTIADLAPRLRAREISPVELTQQALARIAARDADLNAFQLVLADPALAAARTAEREIAAGAWRGPLHGVPVAVKDLFDLAGTPTTAGSRAHDAPLRDADSAVVERLRAAGAVLVGKTRLAEFAYSPGSNNAHFGPTRNPRDPARDAGGSSSGSGAAVADGMAAAALGSDTGGSIRIPASLCGVVGLKPTYGRVSLRGAMPLSWSLDHAGPLARSVVDAALVLECLAGRDRGDRRTRPGPARALGDPREAGVRGLRIGVLGDDGAPEPVGALESSGPWRAGLRALESAGAILVPLDLPVLRTLGIINGAILAMEAAVLHAPGLRARASEYGEFARLRLLAAHAYAPGAYVRAQQARSLGRERFERSCRGLDLLCTPTMPGVAPPLGVPAPTRFTAPFNVLGWPAVSVPAGTIGGLPVGLQLVGRPWDEATALRAARIVETGRSDP